MRGSSAARQEQQQHWWSWRAAATAPQLRPPLGLLAAPAQSTAQHSVSLGRAVRAAVLPGVPNTAHAHTHARTLDAKLGHQQLEEGELVLRLLQAAESVDAHRTHGVRDLCSCALCLEHCWLCTCSGRAEGLEAWGVGPHQHTDTPTQRCPRLDEGLAQPQPGHAPPAPWMASCISCRSCSVWIAGAVPAEGEPGCCSSAVHLAMSAAEPRQCSGAPLLLLLAERRCWHDAAGCGSWPGGPAAAVSWRSSTAQRRRIAIGGWRVNGAAGVRMGGRVCLWRMRAVQA